MLNPIMIVWGQLVFVWLAASTFSIWVIPQDKAACIAYTACVCYVLPLLVFFGDVMPDRHHDGLVAPHTGCSCESWHLQHHGENGDSMDSMILEGCSKGSVMMEIFMS